MSNSKKMKNESGYWRSFRDLNNDPELFEEKAQEFMKGVTDDFDLSKLSGLSRRKFIALLSASAAFTASACTNYREKGEVIPYNQHPEGVIPGIAEFYSSTCTGCSQACGVLVKTREGRPIKIDGNPDHPINQGKICSIGQASILDLYDPARLKKPLKSGREVEWKDADAEIIKELSNINDSGKEIALLSGPVNSPASHKLLTDFTNRFTSAKIYVVDRHESNRNNSWVNKIAPVIKWDEAKVILSLDGDFLGKEKHSIENIRKFVRNRDVNNPDRFNRLYVIEGGFSVTGMNADYRIRLRPDAQLEFVLTLTREIQRRLGGGSGDQKSLESFADKYSIPRKTLNHLLNDLIENRGASIVYAGDLLETEVHVAVNNLNQILGNTSLYDTTQAGINYMNSASAEEWNNFFTKMNNGEIGAVVHLDTNPVYNFPVSLNYAKALKSVPLSIALTELENETSALCKYALPINHYLESWNDFHTRTGVYSLQQPIINSLYHSRQKEAILLTWINDKPYQDNQYHQYLMSNWENELFPKLNAAVDFQTFWYSALETGIVKNNETPGTSYIAANMTAPDGSRADINNNDFVLELKESYHLADGRFANNGWLQELPHPVTKVVWDNYAAISPGSAKKLNVEMNQLLKISTNNQSIEIPAYIQPGMADGVVSIELGYGRKKTGDVGIDVGVNAYVLQNNNMSSYLVRNVKISPAEGTYKLATTQEHHLLEDFFKEEYHKKREIIREANLGEYINNPELLHKDKEPPLSLTEVHYQGVKWGMSIDLNKCIGCTECIAACNVENNIPVIGKDQVEASREMHWLRIDRYYSGTPEDPSVTNQAMLCQHCDNAPCEVVCPVVATTHSPDGLNQMVYNRCVGTRYCSNNCPYKVRRFNFYDFRDHFEDGYYYQPSFDLMRNPEVTVRSRGVMEKCTFCVQRIMEAREDANEQGVPFNGAGVKTACQVACPAEAIVFGNINDPDTDVAKNREHNLGYHVLEETNSRPNITYLAKLRNTYPEDV